MGCLRLRRGRWRIGNESARKERRDCSFDLGRGVVCISVIDRYRIVFDGRSVLCNPHDRPAENVDRNLKFSVPLVKQSSSIAEESNEQPLVQHRTFCQFKSVDRVSGYGRGQATPRHQSDFDRDIDVIFETAMATGMKYLSSFMTYIKTFSNEEARLLCEMP